MALTVIQATGSITFGNTLTLQPGAGKKWNIKLYLKGGATCTAQISMDAGASYYDILDGSAETQTFNFNLILDNTYYVIIKNDAGGINTINYFYTGFEQS